MRVLSAMRRRAAFAWRAAALTVMTAALVTACASGGGNRPVANSGIGPGSTGAVGPAVKVALLLPLSGQGNTAKVAQALKQAGELALFDFDNPNVALVAKDTKGTADGAKAAAEAAVQDGAELIIGPVFAQEVAAAAPVARQANIPMVAFSSDPKVAGSGVYLLSFLAGRDVPRIVSYSVAQGRRNFGALIPQSAYGQVVEAAFRRAVSQQGGNLVILEHYPLDANAVLPPAQRVAQVAKGADGQPGQIDALFLPAGPEMLPTLAALIPYYEINTQQVKLLGTGQWDYPNVGREKPLVGGWFPAPDPQGWRSFTQRYVQTYQQTPPRLASLAYDAMSLAVSLSANPPGQRYTPQQLTRSSGFAGVDGLFRLLPDGTSERGLAILEVQSFGANVVDAAPSSFSLAQY